MKKMHDPCCSKCHHSAEKPCPDLIECRVNGPVCHESIDCRNLRHEALDLISRKKVEKPVIYVGAGTCGLGAGATQTIEAVKAWLASSKKDADVLEVGCIGLCVQEPLMDIQLPGRARVSFGEVTGNKVAGILDKVFAGNIPTENLLGQFSVEGEGSWKDVPEFFASSFQAADTPRARQLWRNQPGSHRRIYRTRRLSRPRENP